MSLSVSVDVATLADMSPKSSVWYPCKRRRDRQTHTRRLLLRTCGRHPIPMQAETGRCSHKPGSANGAKKPPEPGEARTGSPSQPPREPAVRHLDVTSSLQDWEKITV